jgi:hypothetical protein
VEIADHVGPHCGPNHESRDNIAGGVSDGARLSRLYGDVEIAGPGADGRAHQRNRRRAGWSYVGNHVQLDLAMTFIGQADCAILPFSPASKTGEQVDP